MSEHDEYAPALGGSRAEPEPPPAPAPPPETPFTGAEADPEFPPELAAFLGPLGRLAELFAASGASAPSGSAPDQELDALLNDTLRSFADRLTPAFAAFGTIVDAVEEAIAPLLDEVGSRLREPAEAPEPEVFDAIAMDEEIPPVDLPPGA